jgi:molybdopterin converting factor small subunit
MGMEKFYRTVRRQFGINKEQMKQELKTEVIEELREEMEEEVSYIEAQMKEYEQLVAEVNHLLATMRKSRIQQRNEGKQIKMDEFQDDLQPLKSKLRELESSMEQRLERQKALTQ